MHRRAAIFLDGVAEGLVARDRVNIVFEEALAVLHNASDLINIDVVSMLTGCFFQDWLLRSCAPKLDLLPEQRC